MYPHESSTALVMRSIPRSIAVNAARLKRVEIRGMGNRLRHAYDRLSLDIMWDIVQRDVPGLAADARAALDRLPKR